MRAATIAYGGLGLPLAMAALPLYVQLPAYFAGALGLPLATAGAIFVIARIADTVPDPWLGQWADRLAATGRLPVAMVASALVLAVAFAGLWRAPAGHPALAWWLGAMLVAASVSHTFLQVCHLAWGARLGDRPVQVRGAAWREGLGLVGVLLASALPAWLLASPDVRMPVAYPLLFAALLALGLVLLWRGAPRWHAPGVGARAGWRRAWSRPAVRALLPAFFLNAVSVALPATLMLFFVQDQLGAPRLAGLFLVLYFAAGAVGLPVWTRLALRFGPARSWRVGMLTAAGVFVWAAALGPGDTVAFGVLCVLSGLLVGADLALPPVLLATRIPAGDLPAAYYGVWMFLGKLAIAGAGLALPALAAFGYTPGQGPAGALVVAYAALPCALKLAAAALVPPDRTVV